VVDAILLPLVDVVNSDPSGGLNWVKVLAWAALTESDTFADALAGEADISALLAKAVSRSLAGNDDDVQRRTGLAMFGMLSALASADLRGLGHAASERGLDAGFVDQLGAFIAGGLAAGGV
jgi:hypothetical protein